VLLGFQFYNACHAAIETEAISTAEKMAGGTSEVKDFVFRLSRATLSRNLGTMRIRKIELGISVQDPTAIDPILRKIEVRSKNIPNRTSRDPEVITLGMSDLKAFRRSRVSDKIVLDIGDLRFVLDLKKGTARLRRTFSDLRPLTDLQTGTATPTFNYIQDKSDEVRPLGAKSSQKLSECVEFLELVALDIAIASIGGSPQ
jgi:hypothetical protein